MYDIGTKSGGDSFRIHAANATHIKNYPLMTMLAINVILYIYTSLNPEAIGELALTPNTIDWGVVTFNFIHLSFLHILFNMLACFLFAKDIMAYFRNSKLHQWFIYFGFAPIIGLIDTFVTQQSVAGYSGVVMGIIGVASALKFNGYKAILAELVVFHIIVMLLPNNVSVITHAVGFIVGYTYGLGVRTFNTRKPSKPPVKNWRERHGIL